jgi:hypothetical protein
MAVFRILPLLVALLLVGFDCKGAKETTKGTVKGTIYVIGNEPFTTLAVEDSSKTMYRISSSKELREKLQKLQGKVVNVAFSKADTTAEGIVLTVHDYTEIPSDGN